MSKKRPLSLLCVLVLLVSSFVLMQVSGCGDHGGSSTATGTLQTKITDARAFGNISTVHVKIVKVVAVPAGHEGAGDTDTALPVVADLGSGQDVNILSLHFVPQLLGNAVIPAGRYTQLRLILAPNQTPYNNYVTLTSNPGQRLPLTTPSAQQTGLKIVGNFTVTAGTLNTILIDFNPNTAIVFAGNSGQVILKPTGIKILQVYSSLTNAGSVTGVIRSPAFSKWSTATVSVVQRPGNTTVTSGTVFSNFSSPNIWKAPFNAFLPPGSNYKLFVNAVGTSGLQGGGGFQLYSSQPFAITSGVDTSVPPLAGGVVMLAP